MVIRVNISELESKAKYADSLAKELKVKAEEINTIYYNLDSKVKSRNGIGQSMLNLKRQIEAAYEKMYNISKFLFKAAENYRNAETQVTDKAKSLEAMFNFNNYNVMDSLVGLDINALVISDIDNYNVGIEYSTGKAKSSGFLGGLFSAGLGIGVSISKNLFYDPATMALAVSSTFLENLGVVPKGTAQSQYSKIKSLESEAEEALINKYVSNKAYYYGAATLTDFVSMGIGMAKAALGLQQIFAGMSGVGTGIVGGPLTGGSSLVISVEGAASVAVGLVQTGYGTSVFFSSKNNLKSNYKKFKEAISKGGSNAVDEIFKKGKKVLDNFNVDDAYVKPKHLSTTKGNGQKFLGDTKVDAESILKDAMKNGTVKSITDNGLTRAGNASYEIIIDAGKPVGTRGETLIKIVLSEDGGMLSAYPIK